MKTSDAPHILNTSANLLGLCFIILTSLRALGHASTISESITGIAAVFFAVSCWYSFMSMKSKTDKKIERRELVADISFFIGLTIIMVIIIGNVFRVF